jgi:hypothetical protein
MGLTRCIKCSVFLQLQVPDEALSLVMSMGYNQRNAKRALRMNNQDVGGAIDFLAEEKAKKMQKREEDLKRRDEIWWVQLDDVYSFSFSLSRFLNSFFPGSKSSMG